MPALKPYTVGPIALTTTLTTNIFNPAAATGGVNGGSSGQYFLCRHIRIVNKTTAAATVSLWKGATGANAAGTEFAFQATSVPPNQYIEWYGFARFDVADFLVGGAGTATALSIILEGELGVA